IAPRLAFSVGRLPAKLQDAVDRALAGSDDLGSGPASDNMDGLTSVSTDATMGPWLRRKRRMQFLEAEIAADRYFESGKRTLAILRSEFVRFEVRSKEALIGRSTPTQPVDIDLSQAG